MLLRYVIAAVLWVVWFLPFIPRAKAPRQKAVTRDPTARWGMIFQGIGYAAIFSRPALDLPPWRTALGTLFGVVGIVFTAAAVRHLDKQWRFDAALNADHQLIRTGPYSVVRHPIYAGMFAMLLAYGFLLARWPFLIAGVVIFIIGIEIRIHTEEKLLRSRFGEEFETWARRVPAYVPFVR